VTSTPAEELAETLVELADTMSVEFDLDDFLLLLVNRCVDVLGCAAASVYVTDHDARGTSAVAAALEADARERQEGPGYDCCHSGVAVAAPDLADMTDRWPEFAVAARAAGFAATHTVPMGRRGEQLGALTLYMTVPGALPKKDSRTAKAMADIATIGLMQTRAVRRQETLTEQLQHALNSRVVIEQAKGVLAERLGMGMGAAFTALRSYARSHNARVSELALSIVDGNFDTNLLRP
jgi:GAF domain-containing protein